MYVLRSSMKLISSFYTSWTCLLLMSDTRTKYLTVTIIASLAVLIGTITTAPIAQSFVLTGADETSSIFGHFTIVLTDPDGTTYYAQTDNIMHDDGLSSMAIHALGATTIGTISATVFDRMQLYSANEPATSNLDTATPLNESPLAATTAVGTVNSGTPGTVVVVVTWATITINDGTNEGGGDDNGAELRSMAMLNTAGVQFLGLDIPFCTGQTAPTAGFCALATGSTVDIVATITFSG